MEAGSYSFSSEEFWCTLCQLQLIKFLSHYLVLGMEWQVVWSLFHWWKSWEILHSRPHRRWLWAGKASRVYGYCSLPGCSVPLSRSSEPRGPKGLTVEHSYFLSVFFSLWVSDYAWTTSAQRNSVFISGRQDQSALGFYLKRWKRMWKSSVIIIKKNLPKMGNSGHCLCIQINSS